LKSTLNSSRKCKCDYHTEDATWHGTCSGYQYHACRCNECKDGWKQYHDTWAKAQHAQRYVPAPKEFRVCADCDDKFECWVSSNKSRCNSCSKRWQGRHGVRKQKARKKRLWIAQHKLCALCHRPISLEESVLDHDHACCDKNVRYACGECDRAAIHGHCNLIIGFAKDDSWLLSKAINYLKAYH
jgi:Recombination endonuclease VII